MVLVVHPGTGMVKLTVMVLFVRCVAARRHVGSVCDVDVQTNARALAALLGLRNMGDTCYFASLLQLLRTLVSPALAPSPFGDLLRCQRVVPADLWDRVVAWSRDACGVGQQDPRTVIDYFWERTLGMTWLAKFTNGCCSEWVHRK